MHGFEYGCGSFWWIIPLMMIVLCFFLMRSRRWPMMCGWGRQDTDNLQSKGEDSALAILDKRYALGEIDKQEYEERKKTLSESREQS